MIRAVVVALLVAIGATSAAADVAATAYVDEIVVAGGPELATGRAFTAATLRRAGLAPRFADFASEPCGDDGSCLAERARMFGAVVALRITIVEVGDRVSVSVLASDARSTVRRELVPSTDLTRADDHLAGMLRDLVPQPHVRSRVTAWALVGSSAMLAIGGGAALWHARQLRDDFFAEHIDAKGDVYGISRADARAAERRTNNWSTAGALAIGGAVVAGAGAVILFVRDGSGEVRPVGIGVVGTL